MQGMKTLAVVLCLAAASSALDCNRSSNSAFYRARIHETVDNVGPVHLVVGFERLNESRLAERYKQLLSDDTLRLRMPSKIIEDHTKGRRVVYNVGVHSSTAHYLFGMCNFTKTQVKTDKRKFLAAHRCSGPVWNIKIFQLFENETDASDNGCSLLFFSCYITRSQSRSRYACEKLVLVMTEGAGSLSDAEIGDCLAQSRFVHCPSFPEFKATGFCVCDELLHYLNECVEVQAPKGNFSVMSSPADRQNGPNPLIGIGLILGLVLLLVVAIEAFNCLQRR